MNPNEFPIECARALEYSATIVETLESMVPSGANIHRRNMNITNIHFYQAKLKEAIPGAYDPNNNSWLDEGKASDALARLEHLWNASDRASGWLVRLQLPSFLGRNS